MYVCCAVLHSPCCSIDNMQSAFGGCAAAFLPELRRGYALCNVYDHMIFTSPDGKIRYEIKDI